MSTRSRSLIALAAAAALAVSSAAYAGPHHRGGSHYSHHNYSHHHHRHHDNGAWFWGPLAAGAIIYGLTELNRPRRVVVQQPAPVVVQPAPVVVQQPTQVIVQQPATLYQSYQGNVVRYVYWCEGEQGYYPQVRACPTGWKQMPAP